MWPEDQISAKTLLREFADIFSKDNLDLVRTSIGKRNIELTDYTPFKKRYRRILPGLCE